MSDATFKGPTPATPVSLGTLPSRAAGEQPAPMFDVPAAAPAKPRRVRVRVRVRKPAAKKAAPRKAAKKKSQALSRKEVTALAKKRAAAIAAKKKSAPARKARAVGKSPVLAAPYGRQKPDVYARVAQSVAPKNPNRPLEMKNQLQAVIAMTGVLTKSELTLFSQMVGALQAVARNGRKRIIVGLQQVYG